MRGSKIQNIVRARYLRGWLKQGCWAKNQVKDFTIITNNLP